MADDCCPLHVGGGGAKARRRRCIFVGGGCCWMEGFVAASCRCGCSSKEAFEGGLPPHPRFCCCSKYRVCVLCTKSSAASCKDDLSTDLPIVLYRRRGGTTVAQAWGNSVAGLRSLCSQLASHPRELSAAVTTTPIRHT